MVRLEKAVVLAMQTNDSKPPRRLESLPPQHLIGGSASALYPKDLFVRSNQIETQQLALRQAAAD